MTEELKCDVCNKIFPREASDWCECPCCFEGIGVRIK